MGDERHMLHIDPASCLEGPKSEVWIRFIPAKTPARLGNDEVKRDIEVILPALDT
jgi:hypothetical protein